MEIKLAIFLLYKGECGNFCITNITKFKHKHYQIVEVARVCVMDQNVASFN